MVNTFKKRYDRLALRSKILLPFVAIFMGTWFGAALSLGYYVNRTLERQADREARGLASTIVQGFELEQQQLRLNARLLADREAVVRAITTEDFATLREILLPIRIGFNIDRIATIDRNGQFLIDLRQSNLIDTHIQEKLNLSQILNTVELSGLAEVEASDRHNSSLLLGTARIKSDQGTEGAILVGRLIDDRFVEEIVQDIEGEQMAVFHDNRLIATNSTFIRTTNWQPPKVGEFSRLRINTQSYFANTTLFSDLGESNLELVLLTPLNTLQRAQTRLWLMLGLFCLMGIAIAAIAGDRISRAIARRLQHLVEATSQVGKGQLTTRLDTASRDEVGQLSQYFNTMADELEAREKQLKQYVEELEKTLEELATTQSSLLIAEKMSSLGKMVAGIAHEINNPISFIHGNIPHATYYIEQLHLLLALYDQYCPQPTTEIIELREEIDVDFLFEDLENILASMQRGSDRVRNIVLDLRNFSRLDESEYKTVNIHDGLEGALNILHHRLEDDSRDENIHVIKEYAELPSTYCYPGQLNQVFLNLLTNAIDALELAIDNPLEDNYQPTITLKTSFDLQQEMIRILIADNGVGIDTDIRDKIFDPFFTTKAVGQGTGLGLTVSYQIMTKQHNGEILCSSQLGQGTEFEIALPVQK